MAFQPAVNCAEAVIRYTRQGQPMVNRFNFLHGGAYDQGDIDALATLVDAWVGAEWLPVTSAGVTYVRTDVRGLTDELDLVGTANANAGVGALADGDYPNYVTLAVKLWTGLSGRSARGRLYTPVIPFNAITDDNFVTTTFVDALLDALDQLILDAVAGEWLWGVLQRVENGVPLLEAVFRGIIEPQVVDRELDTQRRRMPSK